MSFTHWLEQLTKELRDNPAVQERAYFNRDAVVPGERPSDGDGGRVKPRKSAYGSHWIAPCSKCGRDTIVENPVLFDPDVHLCAACKP